MLPVILEFQRTSTDALDLFYEQAQHFWNAALKARKDKNYSFADHNFVEAFGKYKACSQIDPGDPYYPHKMGMCLYSLSYFPTPTAKENALLAAHNAFKHAIDLHKSAYPRPDEDQKCVRAMYLRDLADCLIEQKRFQVADLIFSEAIAIDPTPLSLAHLGVLKATYLGQAEIGKTYFSEAFAAAARNKDAHPDDAAAAENHAGILKLGREFGLIPPLSLVR